MGCTTKGAQQQSRQDRKTPNVVTADIAAGIKAHIEKETEKGDGYFHLDLDGKPLRLKLVRVHMEYLSNLGPQRHFACVDLADVEGDVYDVDFFMEGDPGNMTVTETIVHKLNGKPFYTWKQNEDKTWHTVPVEEATNELLGVIEGKDQFQFRYQATLPEITENAAMWVPIPQSDSYQSVELVSQKVPGKQQVLHEGEYGNSILYLELGPEDSHKEVDIIYQVERLEKQPYEADWEGLEQYLATGRLMPVDGRFQKIADRVLEEKEQDGPLMQARALYDYVIDSMRYMKYGDYGHGDAVYACDTRSGNCSEFHAFFISLARSAGIPARFAIGAAIPSERDEGGIDGYHCWAEFYAEGKWWPVDISEGNKYTALATYYFGRHPANRIELSRGRDLQVSPGPVSGPINFLAFPVLEIDGQPASAEVFFSFSRNSQ